MMTIVQIGAGRGNDHVSTLYKDGMDLYLVEANEMHINALEAMYPKAAVIHRAIVPNRSQGDSITMFYSIDDAPGYEVTSVYRSHITKHGLSDDSIRSFDVPVMTLSALLDIIHKRIDILFIDIEGLDEEVLYANDLSRYDIANIQIEMIHIKDVNALIAYMAGQGYRITNSSFDRNGYDRIFEKVQQPTTKQ